MSNTPVFIFEISEPSANILKRLGDPSLLRLKQAFEQIGEDFRRRIGWTFANKAGNTNYWPDLSERYKPRKKKKYGHIYPTLVGTGGMRDTFTDTANSENINEIADRTARFGSRNVIASYHQSGGGHLPAREMINAEWIKANSKAWNGIIYAYQASLLRRLGITVKASPDAIYSGQAGLR